MTVIVAVDFPITVYLNLSTHPSSCSAVPADISIAELHFQVTVESDCVISYRLL